jgi:hypothetical protein
MGTHFFREGTTVAVSRNGATILLDRKLGPEQEVVIRSLFAKRRWKHFCSYSDYARWGIRRFVSTRSCVHARVALLN